MNKEQVNLIRQQLKELDSQLQKAFDLDKFQDFQRENNRIHRERNRVVKQCHHKIDKVPEKKSGYVHCIHCQQLFWYCDESPKKVCEYNDKKDPAHDECIHCGMPEERK